MWDPVISQLPEDDFRVVAIDLLGFGNSPKPNWAEFNVKTQVRSIAATFLKYRIVGPVVVVGHSMGALIAVELARRYPRIIKALVLCSPPFYKLARAKGKIVSREEQLRVLYARMNKYPNEIVALSQLAIKHKLINQAYDVNPDNITAYLSALEASIVNQTSLEDAKKIRQSVRIIHGKFDPVVIAANLRELERFNPHVTVTTVLGAHEVKGQLVGATIQAIQAATTEVTAQPRFLKRRST